MTGFGEALRNLATRMPEARAVMIIGADGIPVETVVVQSDVNLDAVAAELTTLLRGSLGASSDTGLGTLQELTVVSAGMTTLIRAITPEYFVLATLAPGALIGRARLALHVACLGLEKEFA